MNGEVFIHTAQTSDKMIFERPNGSLSSVAAMNAWWDELEVNIVGVHKVFEQCRAFIVEALQTRFQSIGAQAFVENSVGRDDGGGLAIFKGLREDMIAIIII